MHKEYFNWFSEHLQRNMEMLVFGHSGTPVIFFPTRTARFYDYEDWKVIDALHNRIEAGEMQIFCIDSMDNESFYCKTAHPSQRINRHLLFERYILFEVLPFIQKKNNCPYIISAGCSLGAYHALNIALRHPLKFSKVVAMSGRYDLTIKLDYFEDLFDGFMNEEIFYNTPSLFLPTLNSEQVLRLIRRLDITIVIGETDAFLQNNIQLHEAMELKKIPHQFYTWTGEAHKAHYWRDMVKLYF